MASVTSLAPSVCTPTTLSRSKAVRAQRTPVLARPAARLAAFRLPSTSRSLALKATTGFCWGPMAGACGPSYHQRWRGSGQRSFAMWADQARNSLWVPVDVEETAEQYTFVADVPGLGKNDVKVHCIALWLGRLRCHLLCLTQTVLHFRQLPTKKQLSKFCLAVHRFKSTRTVN